MLQDIEKSRKEEEERDEARRLRIQKYDEEKAEEAERRRKEEEEKALEDERARLEEIEREKALKVEEEERLEKERLEQVERQEKERLAEVERIEAEKLRLEEEEKRRRKAEEEAEWSRFSEERWKAVRPDASDPTVQNSSSSEEGEREGFVTPPQQSEPVKKELEVSSDKPFVKGVQSHSGAKINFSDFEAISDPFGDLELKTMDDLAELRTILTTNQQNTNQFSSSANGQSHAAYSTGQPISQSGEFDTNFRKLVHLNFQASSQLPITKTVPSTTPNIPSKVPLLPSPSRISPQRRPFCREILSPKVSQPLLFHQHLTLLQHPPTVHNFLKGNTNLEG